MWDTHVNLPTHLRSDVGGMQILQNSEPLCTFQNTGLLTQQCSSKDSSLHSYFS